MAAADGMLLLRDGPGTDTSAPATLPQMSEGMLPATEHVWAVRDDDVSYASKMCAFGTSRAAEEVKHTNLTGGNAAFSGGEVMVLPNGALIVNGRNGRYGIRSAAEMADVALAFKNSGYTV